LGERRRRKRETERGRRRRSTFKTLFLPLFVTSTSRLLSLHQYSASFSYSTCAAFPLLEIACAKADHYPNSFAFVSLLVLAEPVAMSAKRPAAPKSKAVKPLKAMGKGKGKQQSKDKGDKDSTQPTKRPSATKVVGSHGKPSARDEMPVLPSSNFRTN
jgi:hypothetical protein